MKIWRRLIAQWTKKFEKFCPKYSGHIFSNFSFIFWAMGWLQIFYSEISWPLDVLTDAHMTYYSMTAKSESDVCQTDLHFDPNYQYDLSNEKEQIDAKRVHPNVHKIYSLGLYLCTNRYILDKSWKQHRWHVQSFHHCYRIGSHCSTGFPFTSMKAKGTKY